MKTTTIDTTIRIYVANLAAYNNGILAGKWLDLPCDNLDEELQSIIDMHEDGEELAIHDYEAPFHINEYDSIEELNEIAEQLEYMDKHDQQKLVYLMNDECTFEQAMDELDDCYFYPGMTLEQVAEEMVAEGLFGTIPESIINYIDYAAIARDLSYDDYCETDAGVFSRG